MLMLHGKTCFMGSNVPELAVLSSDPRPGVGDIISLLADGVGSVPVTAVGRNYYSVYRG